MKYVLVSGGVISGIGKGILASSTGVLLRSLGLSVSYIKIDPYLNLDAGTMAPTEHGEVFILDDGGETDLDLGNAERYLDISLKRDNNITTGKIYQSVINRERRGEFLGRTVQIVPHLTDAIQEWIARVASTPVDDSGKEPDVCIIELGGTVGDIESGPFNEALRQLRLNTEENAEKSFLHIFVSLLPKVGSEFKTKPTQAAVKESRGVGLTPDIIACRCESPLEKATVDKVALFCQVRRQQVLTVHNVDSTYHVPMLLEKQRMKELLGWGLGLDAMSITSKRQARGADIWSEWKLLTGVTDQLFPEVKIALVNKYNSMHDAFLSVEKALEHAAMQCRRRLNLVWIDASHLESKTSETSPAEYHTAWLHLSTAQGILVPGGFGTRGHMGMIEAAMLARTKNVPYLGICLGMQIAVIEHARNLLGLPDASSSEFDPQTKDPVIIPMEEIDQEVLGGTMRLGLHPTLWEPDTEWSKLRTLYSLMRPSQEIKSGGIDGPSSPRASFSRDPKIILERHRHRYEVNPKPAYLEAFKEKGLHFIGRDDKGVRMEIIERKDHPYYVCVQFHPEKLSRVLRPSPPILGFFAAAAGCLDEVMERLRSAQGPGLVNGNGHTNSIGSLVNGVGHASI